MASEAHIITFRDIIPIKAVYVYFTGLAILSYLFPESRRELLQAAEFTIFTLAWIYTFVLTAASGRMILFTALIIVGWACNLVYLYYFWRIYRLRGEAFALFNAMFQGAISCSAGATVLGLAWYRELKGIPIIEAERPAGRQPLETHTEKDVNAVDNVNQH